MPVIGWPLDATDPAIKQYIAWIYLLKNRIELLVSLALTEHKYKNDDMFAEFSLFTLFVL